MLRALAIVAVVCLAPPVARAEEFWAPASQNQKPDSRALTIATGDVYLQQARLGAFDEWRSAGGPNAGVRWSRRVEADARAALLAYEKAIKLEDEPVARYRAFTAATYLDMREGWEKVVEHADGLRAVDPEDPHAWSLAFETAIAHSKLGMLGGPSADHHFERAVAEYARWRRLLDVSSLHAMRVANVITNTAEIQMALGNLDESIALYREAHELNDGGPSSALTLVGLAVAYDRDGQWVNAEEAMNKAFLRTNGNIEGVLTQPGVFFVPDGDIHYYRALAFHMKGKVKDALREYEIYLVTCVSDRYKDRAREHVAELEAKK